MYPNTQKESQAKNHWAIPFAKQEDMWAAASGMSHIPPPLVADLYGILRSPKVRRIFKRSLNQALTVAA